MAKSNLNYQPVAGVCA